MILTFLIFVFLKGPQKVKYGKDNIITAKDIVIATGSVPFVPKGIEVDGTCLVLNVDLLREKPEKILHFLGAKAMIIASGLDSLNVYTLVLQERLSSRVTMP